MGKEVYARRYAQAVFDIALETKQLDKWQSDLSQLARLGEDATIVDLLQSPRLHFEDRAKLLSEQLSGAGPLALNLTHLLVARGKLGIAGDIADGYQRLLNKHRGIEQVDVTTAVQLDDNERLRLEKRLSKLLDKKVVLETKVDASILGGIIAQIDDRLLDGSTRGKLLALKRELGR